MGTAIPVAMLVRLIEESPDSCVKSVCRKGDVDDEIVFIKDDVDVDVLNIIIAVDRLVAVALKSTKDLDVEGSSLVRVVAGRIKEEENERKPCTLLLLECKEWSKTAGKTKERRL